MLSPPPNRGATTARRAGGAPGRILGSHFVSGADPLAYVVLRGLGRDVTVKGFVRQENGYTRVDIESVEATTTANLNMRVSPRVGATVITVIPRGTTVEITNMSRDGGWYTVIFGGTDGWSSASYIRVGR